MVLVVLDFKRNSNSVSKSIVQTPVLMIADRWVIHFCFHFSFDCVNRELETKSILVLFRLYIKST